MNTTVVGCIYSSVLTTNSRTYSPISCSIPNYYYEAIQLSIVTNGYYRISGNSTIGLHAYIYQNNFDPVNPSTDLRVEKGSDLGFRLDISFKANTVYVLVVRSLISYQTGSFSIVAEGPDNINATKIGKFGFCEIVHICQIGP